MTNGQWFTAHDGAQWWFDSGALSLDFAYTGAMDDNPRHERMHAPADLAAWLTDRIDRVGGEATERELVDALALRSAVAGVARAVVARRNAEADDVDTINLFAATPDIPPVLAGGNRQAGRSAVRVGQALATIARDAVALFADEAHDRLRECAADDCALVFYDESRSNNRRWCSMQRCGNRAKVRAHRARATVAG